MADDLTLRPMSEAPRDGKRVLIVLAPAWGGAAYLATWHAGRRGWVECGDDSEFCHWDEDRIAGWVCAFPDFDAPVTTETLARMASDIARLLPAEDRAALVCSLLDDEVIEGLAKRKSSRFEAGVFRLYHADALRALRETDNV